MRDRNETGDELVLVLMAGLPGTGKSTLATARRGRSGRHSVGR